LCKLTAEQGVIPVDNQSTKLQDSAKGIGQKEDKNTHAASSVKLFASSVTGELTELLINNDGANGLVSMEFLCLNGMARFFLTLMTSDPLITGLPIQAFSLSGYPLNIIVTPFRVRFIVQRRALSH